jgi:peptidoglycan/xylan/chitin deacetylase (PgdA/CDA1 family)
MGGQVFLMYHELAIAGQPLCQSDPGYTRYCVRQEDFSAQMRWLQESGRRGISVSEVLSRRAPQAVVITFDDGCATDLRIAAPQLKERGFGATFYITLGFLGKPGFLTAAEVRELSDAGFEIGCHSRTHPYLPDLDGKGLEEEIVGAKKELEQIIGRRVQHFSCPGGRYDQRVVDVARQGGYQSLATSRPHANTPGTDPFALGRVALLQGMPLAAFENLCAGKGLWKLTLRDTLRGSVKSALGNKLYDRLRGSLLQEEPRS